MRIALITRHWPTQRAGGLAFVCQDRAHELARQGHDVHVITTSLQWEGGGGGTIHENDVAVHYTDSAACLKWTQAFALDAQALVRTLEPEVVHLDSFDRNAASWWPRSAPKVVVTMHGFGMGAWLTLLNRARTFGEELPPLPLADVRAEIEALERADAVLAVSRWEARMLRDQYGLSNVQLVYNPIAPAFFADPTGTAPRCGAMCAAVSGAKTRGFELAKRACQAARVPFRVVSGIPRVRMPQVYDETEVLLLPTSYAQGYDLTVAEARARGVPAIMAPTGSYLDEAAPWDVLAPVAELEAWVEALRARRWGQVPAGAAAMHTPAAHVTCWLAAVRNARRRELETIPEPAPSKRQSVRHR